MAKRQLQFNIRMSPSEVVRLNRLAEHLGCSTHSVIRILLKREGDALGICPAPDAEDVQPLKVG